MDKKNSIRIYPTLGIFFIHVISHYIWFYPVKNSNQTRDKIKYILPPLLSKCPNITKLETDEMTG